MSTVSYPHPAPQSVRDDDNTDVDGYSESTGKLDHVTPDPTPFVSPTYQPMWAPNQVS